VLPWRRRDLTPNEIDDMKFLYQGVAVLFGFIGLGMVVTSFF
jgi:hypothetical protein